jgi:speckle-type POZ protein
VEPERSPKYSTLAEDMSRAFDTGKFTDVQLICDNEVCPAHRVVLAARSKVFAAMFGSETFKESVSRKVVIEETDPLSVRFFIQFLYEDTLDQQSLTADFTLCHSLIMLANRYDVDALRGKCSEIILKHHLHVDKASQILKIAHENNVEDLKEQTLSFISNPRNVDSVMATKEFKNLDSDIVQEVLRLVVSTRPSPNFRRKARSSPSSQHTSSSSKRIRTLDLSDEDHVRAPPNQGEEGPEDDT